MRNYIVRQEEASDCGVCSLLSIIRYYGGNANLEELRIKSQTDKSGVNAYNLLECAKQYGFDVKGIKTNNLDNSNLPCIVHLKINESLSHFACLYKVENEKVILMDPDKGIIKMNKEDFYSKFTGITLLLYPKCKIPDYENNNVIKKDFIDFLKENKKYILSIFILNLLFIIVSIIGSMYIKLVDYYKYIYYIYFGFILIEGLIAYLSYKLSYMNEEISNKCINKLQNKFFKYILNLPLRYLHVKDLGEIVKRCEEINISSTVIISSFLSLLLNSFILIISLITLSFFYPKIIVLIIIHLLLIITITILTNKKINNHIKNAINESTIYNNRLIEYVYSLTSIKHFKNETFIQEKYEKYLENDINKTYEYKKCLYKYDNIKRFLNSIIRLSINVYLINLIIRKTALFQDFIIINSIMELSFSSIQNIAAIIPNYLLVKSYFNKINDFYNIPFKEIKDGNKKYKKQDINIKNLSFGYNPKSKIIENIRFKIKSGEKVILKGDSGVGKSTICKILGKEYDNYNGDIFIGEYNLKDINKEYHLNNFCYLSQNEKIFSGTIKENIIMGEKEDKIKLNKVINICKLSRITDKHPFGLDRYLFGGAEDLSGGERQLIILARALYRNTRILILDEALSEVNIDIEQEILNDICDEYKNTTMIYITHNSEEIYKNKRIIHV